ncbi:uncharacterized protein LOC135497129 [Lineus longissimus]|uniref:uncharacterized protein LOC135497129 n=1 Tax=Lineus longissimus TaxID=88925 RepID=UPI00315CED80
MNKKISDGLAIVVTKFFQQNIFFRNQLQIRGNIEVSVDSISFTCSLDERLRKQCSDGTDSTQFVSHPNLQSQVRSPRTISESTNLTFDADDAAVDAAVSMIDDFDEAMLSLGDSLNESKGIRVGLSASNSSLPSVDRFSTTSERRSTINMDSILPYEKSWSSESVKSIQNERNIFVKDSELLLTSERLSLTSKPQMTLVPISVQDTSVQNPVANLALNDLSKSMLSKDRTFPSVNASTALIPMQPSLSQTWTHILQYLVGQSQNMDASSLANLIDNINQIMFNRNQPSPPTPTVNSPTPNFSESFLQELSNLLNSSQTSVEISDLYNPDFNYFVDNMRNPPVPPNSPTRPESRLGPLLSSSEFFSSLETYQMTNSTQNSGADQSEFDSEIPTPGLRKRTESEISTWQPQEIQTIDTGHDELDQLPLSGELDGDEGTVEQKPLSLQESIAEMLSGKDTRFSGLQNDVWFGQGKRVVEKKDDVRQSQDQTRHRHMSENLPISHHEDSLRHRHMSENVRNLFSQTEMQTVTPQGNVTDNQDIFSRVHEEHVRHRHASENLSLFSQEHAPHTRMRHRSEHTLGFTQVNDEPTSVRHLSGGFSQLQCEHDQTRHSSGNTGTFSPMDRLRHCSGNTEVFSPAPVNTSVERIRHTSGNTQDIEQIDSDVSRMRHISGEPQVNPQLEMSVGGFRQNVDRDIVTEGNPNILNLNQINTNIFQQIDSGVAGLDQVIVVREASMLQQNLDSNRVRQLSGDTEYSGDIAGNRSRHVSGSVQECSQFSVEEGQMSENTHEHSGLIQEQKRLRHLSGNVQTFQPLQAFQSKPHLGFADGQFMPQVDAEVSRILQGNIAQSFSQQGHVEENQSHHGTESTPIFSPAESMKIRHASVTFSPVVSVLQRERDTSGTPQLFQATQEFSEMRPASETAALMQQVQDEANRIRHASETAVLMSHSQSQEDASRVRHTSDTLQKTNKKPQPTDMLVFSEILDSAKRRKLVENSTSSKNVHIYPEKNTGQVEDLSENVHILSMEPKKEVSSQLDAMQNQETGGSDWIDEQEEEDDDIPLSQYRYTCPACGDKLRDLNALSAHKVTAHNNLRCVVCSKKCQSLHKLGEHIRRHTNTPKWTCEICGKGFIYANSYKLHQMKHKNERPYLCEQCGKTYTSKGQLETHKREHKDVREYGNICPLCAKVFKTKTHLKTHLISHTDIRPWVCDLCGKSFKTKQSLTSHMKTHSNIRPYSCEICGRAFKQVEGLSSHKQTHKDGTKEYQCKECLKVFKTSYSLRDHERLVHNCKVFQCAECEQTFKSKAAVEKHIVRKHTNVRKVWDCPLCEGVFPEERYLKEHLRSEHTPPKKRRTKKQKSQENGPCEAVPSVGNLLQDTGDQLDSDLITTIQIQHPTALLQMVPIDLNSLPPQNILSDDVGSGEGNKATDRAFVQYVAVGSNIDIESSVT